MLTLNRPLEMLQSARLFATSNMHRSAGSWNECPVWAGRKLAMRLVDSNHPRPIEPRVFADLLQKSPCRFDIPARGRPENHNDVAQK